MLATKQQPIKRYKGTILLVEDNRVNQLLVQSFIKKLNIKIKVVENGLEAIEAIRKEQFSLILMDLEMPILGGLAAARQIREEGLTPVPILALTAHKDPGIRRLCKEAKMNGFMIKPITMKSLVAELDKYLL